MSHKTSTRATLAAEIQRNVGLSKTESAEFVDDIVEQVTTALASGESVKIAGFGSFVLMEKGERIGRNPKTGKSAIIPARKVLSFKASQVLKDEIIKAG